MIERGCVMEGKAKKSIGGFLAVLVCGMIGMLTAYLWPMFTMWFIHTDMLWPLSMGLFVVIMLLSAVIPSAPVAISDYFKIRKSNIFAVVCSLFMGLPVTIRQIMNWSIYTQPSFQNGWRVEGGSGWIVAFCIAFPGIMLIVATFAQMADVGDASSPARPISVKNKPVAVEDTTPLSKKSRKVALFLAAFPWTGFLGIDRFYLGYIWTGIFKFLSAGGLLILYIVDIVRLAKGTMRDKDGNKLR